MALQQVEQRVRPFTLVRHAIEKDIMIKDFNISEKGHGSYWLLGILRWVMVLIFISFGIQKFTPQSADGIALYISNSPFVSWLSIFGIRGEANLLGIIELTTAALLAAGAFIPILSALGSLMGIGTFAITWSFFFSTPGVVKWSISTDPIAWNLTGEFLFKDVVFLCVCIVLFLASLPKKVVPLRSNRHPDIVAQRPLCAKNGHLVLIQSRACEKAGRRGQPKCLAIFAEVGSADELSVPHCC
jgi:uncharacterized membrane protein YkgB